MPYLRAHLATLLAVVSLAASGCHDPSSPMASLADAQQRWLRARPAAYRITLLRSCECLYSVPLVIEVRGDSVTAARVQTTGEPVPATTGAAISVDGLFTVVGQALSRRVVQLDATYDPRLGYPTHIYIDYAAPVVDDEIAYSVIAFEPL